MRAAFALILLASTTAAARSEDRNLPEFEAVQIAAGIRATVELGNVRSVRVEAEDAGTEARHQTVIARDNAAEAQRQAKIAQDNEDEARKQTQLARESAAEAEAQAERSDAK